MGTWCQRTWRVRIDFLKTPHGRGKPDDFRSRPGKPRRRFAPAGADAAPAARSGSVGTNPSRAGGAARSGAVGTVARETARGLTLWRPRSADEQVAPEATRYGRAPRDAVHRGALISADLLSAALATLFAVGLVGGRAPGLQVFALVPLVVLLSRPLRLYGRDALVLRASTLNEAPSALTVSVLYAVAVWLTDDILIGDPLTKAEFLALWLGLFLLMLAARALARSSAHRASRPERCLLVSADPFRFDRLRESLRLGHQTGADAVLGVVLDASAIETLASGGLRRLISEHRIDRVIIAPGNADSESVVNLVRDAEACGVKVSLLHSFGEVLGSAVASDELPAGTMLTVRPLGYRGWSPALKRGFDIFVGGLIVALLAPLLLAIASAIKLTSSGPVLFRQPRVGRGGRAFELLKFRSMIENADDLKHSLLARNEAEGLFKIDRDPRVTRVGQWLRRTSLDELPQLFNVLRGEMSLVGPRPLIIEEDRHIEGWHRRRLDLRPGMTGPWQVLCSRWHWHVPLNEMVVIDYLYLVNWSLWQDVKCLLRTVPCVIGRRGM